MSRYFVFFLIFAVAFTLIPYAATLTSEDTQTAFAETEEEKDYVKVQTSEGVLSVGRREYLCGCVCALGDYIDSDESIKAVAVGIYSRLLYCRSRGIHDTGDVCDDSACCFSFVSGQEAAKTVGNDKYERVCRCIAQIEGIYAAYDNEPINALTTYISTGNTESVNDGDGNAIPYLQSADSSADRQSPKYISTKKFDADKLKTVLQSKFGAVLGEDTTQWITKIKRSKAGGVISVTVGKNTVSGDELRKALGLISICYSYNVYEGVFTFTQKGIGTNAGLSLNGAEQMALNGSDYKEILLHYYTGIEIKE